ncbi:MAG: FAD-dependent monooxygenase, partial [Polyangiaceae bacterium]|nr:FAD-dependent monooxygenase [Polyangiaceae bacterium]
MSEAKDSAAGPQVLVVGAGPTGLVLALWLTRLGVRVRIVDGAPEPGQTSRALAVHARTLELYRQLGLAHEVVRAGLPLSGANVWARGRHEGRLEFSAPGAGMTPFPYVLTYPQDEHERLLSQKLESLGVIIERGAELLDFEERSGHVTARLRGPDGVVRGCDVPFIAGCDGARSAVRHTLGVGFHGGTYAHLFYVADVEAEGPQMNREVHVAFADDGNFVVCFGLRDARHARLIGAVRDEAIAGDAGARPTERHDGLEWNDVSRHVVEQIRLAVKKVSWFSTYRVHHRVASRFRVGRAFLLGDAAHVHSPVGGQGMNTGIGDACNLAWKLAMVLRGTADPGLLDSYEPERMPFARTLVGTTDRAFELVTAPGTIARRMRTDVGPRVLTTAFRFEAIRRLLFKTVSQVRIHYRRSPLSAGRAGRIHGGDRLPWVPTVGAGDNFDPLTSLGWQVHVYGDSPRELTRSPGARGLPMHVFPWSESAAGAGLERDSAYLVRPDGYVALATSGAGAAD